MKKYKTICNRCGKDIVGVAGINWNEGFKQGYAKAIDDVRKAVGNKIILLNATEDSLIKSSENYPDLSGLLAERIKELDDMLKEIARLSHSQQPCKTNGEESHNLSKRNCSTPSADTHIPKLAKEKTK